MSSKTITKKIINTPESCVDDNLRGILALYPNLTLHPKHRVITISQNTDSGRVAIIGGGGSGHEPFTSGFIGAGMLDGSVAGGVFASPPTGNILYAITQLSKYNSGGVLVSLGNYTGDRLNFGKAVEKAKIAGINVEALIIGEDVASSQNKTGGRSMCGEIYIYKLCGAMSAKGYDLQYIRNMVLEVNNNMATLGVCLTACSLPGQPPLFEIASDEMEIGAGVHGEAGIQKRKMCTAKETVAIILDAVVAHLKLKTGTRVAAMINNMGGTSCMEMNIIAAETKDYLDQKQIKMERLYSGSMKTSLEMQGFQICLLHLNKVNGDLWLDLLDAPTESVAWVGSTISVPNGEARCNNTDDDVLLQNSGRKQGLGPRLSKQEQNVLRGSLEAAADEVIKCEEVLNRLDSGCGDGDCGITLKKFGEAILTYLKTASLEYPSDVMWELSEMAETDMGGTSGGIYSLGLSAASQALTNATNNCRDSWLSAWESAMQAITKYGGADPGDRTMLDTLYTASVTFKQTMKDDLKTSLRKTALSADKGANLTANMVARAGRASYVASEYLQHEDAGARAVAVWMGAAMEYIAQNY